MENPTQYFCLIWKTQDIFKQNIEVPLIYLLSKEKKFLVVRKEMSKL